MSSQYRKIKYQEEAAYGNTINRYLYIWSHDTCDIVHVYDDNGEELFLFSETEFDMGEALATAFTNWKDERMELVSHKEWDEVVKKNKLNTTERVIDQLASEVILWQKAFNQTQEELEKLDGKERFRVMVEKKQHIIDLAYGKFRDDE